MHALSWCSGRGTIPRRHGGHEARGRHAACVAVCSLHNNGLSPQPRTGQPLQLVFVTTEIAPWSKVGGLADVLAGLPAALAAQYARNTLTQHTTAHSEARPHRGHRVMTVAPLYDEYPDVCDTGVTLPVEVPPWCAALHKPPSLPAARLQQQLDAQGLFAGYWHTRSRGVDHVFVRHAYYHAAEVYGDTGSSYAARATNGAAVRHNILSQAALAAPVLLWDMATLPPAVVGDAHAVHVGVGSGGGSGAHIPVVNSHVLALDSLVPDADVPDDAAALWDAVLGRGTHMRAPLIGGMRAAHPCSPSRSRASPARHVVRAQAGAVDTAPLQHQQPLVFVANDWPTAPALLRLAHVHARPSRRTRMAEEGWRRLLSMPAMEQREGGGEERVVAAAPQFEGARQGPVMEPTMEPAATVSLGRYYQELLRLRAVVQPRLGGAQSVLCIHNFAYQGVFDKATFGKMCLPASALIPLSCDCAAPRRVVEGVAAAPNSTRGLMAGARHATRIGGALRGPCCRQVNWLRGAIRESDAVVTVSPGYAREIQGDPLLTVVRDAMRVQKPVLGIMNGIDTTTWTPAEDPYLLPALRYDERQAVQAKTLAKLQLQSQLGLCRDANATLFAFVGRLTQQKGVDVLLAAAPALLSTGGRVDGAGGRQLVMLGTGGMWEECAIKQLQTAFPGRAVGVAAFDERLAHLIYAAADVLVVPSRFEPCGLVAQCGARYGAVPLVASTGGLQDLVTEEVGYCMPAVGRADDTIAFRRAVDALLRSMVAAAAEHVAGGPYRAKQRACMQLDLGWERPAVQWDAMLQRVVKAATSD